MTHCAAEGDTLCAEIRAALEVSHGKIASKTFFLLSSKMAWLKLRDVAKRVSSAIEVVDAGTMLGTVVFNTVRLAHLACCLYNGRVSSELPYAIPALTPTQLLWKSYLLSLAAKRFLGWGYCFINTSSKQTGSRSKSSAIKK